MCAWRAWDFIHNCRVRHGGGLRQRRRCRIRPRCRRQRCRRLRLRRRHRLRRRRRRMYAIRGDFHSDGECRYRCAAAFGPGLQWPHTRARILAPAPPSVVVLWPKVSADDGAVGERDDAGLVALIDGIVVGGPRRVGHLIHGTTTVADVGMLGVLRREVSEPRSRRDERDEEEATHPPRLVDRSVLSDSVRSFLPIAAIVGRSVPSGFEGRAVSIFAPMPLSPR